MNDSFQNYDRLNGYASRDSKELFSGSSIC
jgi:hypothetical protein